MKGNHGVKCFLAASKRRVDFNVSFVESMGRKPCWLDFGGGAFSLVAMDISSEWISKLNKQQQQAALKTEGPLLILAGAGSGKTTVLVSRTGYILSKKLAKPEEVMILTFTNKAARELKHRVAARLGKGSKKVWAGTFHSFGLQLLKKHYKLAGLPEKFGLIDASDSRSIIKELLKDRRHYTKDDFNVETIQAVMSDLRAGKKIGPKVDEMYKEMADWLLPCYLSKMFTLGVIDFDGLILKPLELFEENPDLAAEYKNMFKYLMVDEFQDTNHIQMRLVKSICNDNENIAVVGDDDQSIYGWRGAEIQNILNFPNLFSNCQVVRLETNYRSTPQIINMANAVITKNAHRHEKQLLPASHAENGNLPEVFIYDNEEDECEQIAEQIYHFRREGFKNKDIAILFRSNSQGGLLEGTLRRHNIEYDMTGGPALIDRKEVKDTLAYIRSALMPNDVSVRRILNTPPRGIGDGSVHKILEFQEKNEITFLQALTKWQEAEVNPRTGQKIVEFLEKLEQIKNRLIQPSTYSFAEIVPRFLFDLGYRDMVLNSYKDKGVAQRKWLLVEVIGRILDGFVNKNGHSQKTVREFLEALELRDVDTDSDDEEKDNIQMLTLHASKGLEYPIVILMGIDEGLLPHETLGSDISEERRLFYVGVTRAKKHLVLTRSRLRKRYGKWREVAPSRFLCEVPTELVKTYDNGFRPLDEGDRVSMLQALYAKLDKPRGPEA